MIRPASIAAVCVLAFLLNPCAPRAAQVTNLAAACRHGQTFLTWTSPPGTGYTYRVYASTAPIASGADVAAAIPLGSVGDSTWYDRRLSLLRRQTYAYCPDSLSGPLDPTQGLFVASLAADGFRCYAVTAQLDGEDEDTTITLGGNSLPGPVAEHAEAPWPVYQRTVYETYGATQVYTLWTGDTDVPGFPAMADRPSTAFDCGLIPGGEAPTNALMICPHWWSGDFLQSLGGSGAPGEWRLSVDDWLPNGDLATFYYGYHQGYDFTSDANVPPTTGLDVDYTMRRVIHTVRWAMSAFPVDTNRVYVMGVSMGGTCAAFLSLVRPELVAGEYALLPKVNFSVLDPYQNPFLSQTDTEWGTIGTDLPCSEGYPVYDRLNAGFMAGVCEAAGASPMLMFCGRLDFVVGWYEKPAYFRAMNAHRQAGWFFFDMRYHVNGAGGYWFPMQDPTYLYRFRRNLSFPALSNCSANGDPGNGSYYSGDTNGSFNGFLEWDTTVVDVPDRWEVVLRPRGLVSSLGPVSPPDSMTVDVTPRRLQQFAVSRNQVYAFSETRLSDSTVVRSGTLSADTLGLLTVRGVTVRAGGTRLAVWPAGVAATPGTPASRIPVRLGIQTSGNPVRDAVRFTVTWPGGGEARIDLLSADGRLARSVARGPASAGAAAHTFDPRGLPAGVYWLVARQGAQHAAARVVVLR